ncbi:hypothetical protein B0F90DRAFT_1733704, partial [Multifurca ochricompacta]
MGPFVTTYSRGGASALLLCEVIESLLGNLRRVMSGLSHTEQLFLLTRKSSPDCAL